MNYFSHGIRFLDRPYFLAGTAVPDWLRVSDNGVRVRSKNVQPFALNDGSIRSELAAGILQHLHDDDAFHGAASFIQISAQLAVLFRKSLPQDEGMRTGFLGHIVTELLLDGILAERFPDRLRAYYLALTQIDPQVVLSHVNEMARDPAQRLAEFIPLFHREQFLWDYGNANRLLHRLNQVLRRVKLPPLPAEFRQSLEAAKSIVNKEFERLLPFLIDEIA